MASDNVGSKGQNGGFYGVHRVSSGLSHDHEHGKL